jgi:hypothetical protein
MRPTKKGLLNCTFKPTPSTTPAVPALLPAAVETTPPAGMIARMRLSMPSPT